MNLLILVAAALLFNREQHSAERLAWQREKLEMVDRMNIALGTATEAEKSAVLAITDEDSENFARQARAASSAVEQGRSELEELLRGRGTQDQRDLLAKFARAFAEFRRADEQILALAVKGTNLKAYALAYGPAADTLKDMEGALAHLVAERAASPDFARITALALGADIAALHVHILLPPHIAEATDERMASLEAEMGRAEDEVREYLDGLRALAPSADLEAAVSHWARYLAIKKNILALSHENTNVRSLSLSLSQKRHITAACQAALGELRAAVEAEPIGAPYYRPVLPR